ncbi:MAG: RloB family protein [Ardenticatenaceae bacterium]
MAKNKRKGRKRSSGSHKRQAGRHSTRKSILIVCEGTETEPAYFNEFKAQLNLPLVEIVGKGTGEGHSGVVKHALQLKKEREKQYNSPKKRRKSLTKVPFDEVWCVFDCEAPLYRHKFYQAIKEAKKNGFQLAVSNPAFEYWYLLHFKDTRRFFANAGQIIQALRQHIPDYRKNKNVFHKLYPHTDKAIERAKRSFKKPSHDGDQYPNPSTLVFKLVEKLQNMSTESIFR